MELLIYNQAYETQVVEPWNQELFADPITVYKFRRQALLGDNFDSDLCYVAREDEKTVGFLLATKRKFPYLERGTEPERGWINVMFVTGEYQGKGIGTELLTRAEGDLKARGAENITLVTYSPSYFFPGADTEDYPGGASLSEKHSYIQGKTNYPMCKDLHGYRLLDETERRLKKANEAGFCFEMSTYQYAVDLLNFVRDEFGGGWRRNYPLTMQHDWAKDCILPVLDQQDQICGFCTRMIDENPMRSGLIGTAERVRNQRLGSILFDLAQLEMEKREIYYLYFISTDEPGRRLYERHGVHVFRTFKDYRKNLQGREQDMETAKHVVSIGAHSLGAELLGGSLVIKYAKQGSRCTLIYMIQGKLEDLNAAEEEKQMYLKSFLDQNQRTVKALGGDTIWLGYVPSSMPFLEDFVGRLEEYFEEEKVELVVIHWRGSMHPRCINTHDTATLAVKHLRKKGNPTRLVYGETSEDLQGFTPQAYYSLSERETDQWFRAFKEYQVFRGEINDFPYIPYYATNLKVGGIEPGNDCNTVGHMYASQIEGRLWQG